MLLLSNDAMSAMRQYPGTSSFENGADEVFVEPTEQRLVKLVEDSRRQEEV